MSAGTTEDTTRKFSHFPDPSHFDPPTLTAGYQPVAATCKNSNYPNANISDKKAIEVTPHTFLHFSNSPHLPLAGPGYQPVATTNKTAAPIPEFSVSTPASGPPDFVLLNVFTLICCGFLFGLVGLIFSHQVGIEKRRGNHKGAKIASCMALSCGVCGIITGITLITSLCAYYVLK